MLLSLLDASGPVGHEGWRPLAGKYSVNEGVVRPG